MSDVIEAVSIQPRPATEGEAISQNPPERSNSPDSFQLKLQAFEGPLDLLLHLIREHKIEIYDIPIVDITKQYIDYIALMKEFNLEVAGEFLVMAATLIHIKSRMLLPVEVEDEEPAEDPRAELVQRLLEYQAYKDATQHFRHREDIWKNIFQRTVPEEDLEHEPEPVLHEASVFDLITAFQKLLAKAPEQAIEITRETLTVADKINYLVERLEREESIKFETLFEEGYTRVTLLVTFLALLEVIRLGLARIYQEKAFSSIWILNPAKEHPQFVENSETGDEEAYELGGEVSKLTEEVLS